MVTSFINQCTIIMVTMQYIMIKLYFIMLIKANTNFNLKAINLINCN